MAIHNILWDTGGVIFSFDQTKCDTRLAKACNRTVADTTAMLFGGSAGGREYNAGLVEALNLGKIDERQFYRSVKDVLGIDLTYDEFVEAWTDIFTPNAHVIDYIRRAHRAGIPQAILSSTNLLHWKKMNSMFDLESLLGRKNIVCTYHPDAGAKKPTNELFDATFKRVGWQKEETAYVDDVERYVKAAKAYGCGDGVHVDLAKPDFQHRCISDLEALGFKP